MASTTDKEFDDLKRKIRDLKRRHKDLKIPKGWETLSLHNLRIFYADRLRAVGTNAADGGRER